MTADLKEDGGKIQVWTNRNWIVGLCTRGSVPYNADPNSQSEGIWVNSAAADASMMSYPGRSDGFHRGGGTREYPGNGGLSEVSRGHSTWKKKKVREGLNLLTKEHWKMSKSKIKPKSPPGRQLRLLEAGGTPSSASGDGIPGHDRRALLLSRLSSQRTLTTNLLEKVAYPSSLAASFQRVKRNGGRGGVDHVSIPAYESVFSSRLSQLQQALLSGEYVPAPVLSLRIPKASGGWRELGIPTVEDRVVQQSIQSRLQPVYEPYFSKYSYGFRPGRNAQQAVMQASRYVSEGKRWVVDLDLSNFFDEINHDRLMSRLSKSISDKGLLRLIHLYLKAGVMRDGLCSQQLSGTPQGGPLSPLLSNIVLDELDQELERRGLSFVRYADDCNIYVKSRRSADRVLDSIGRYIEEKLKLKLNWEKSGVRECGQVNYLGHTIEDNGRIRVSDVGHARFKRKIRELTKRNRGLRFDQILGSVNQLVEGWGVYYRSCNTWLSHLRDLDGWIRKRLRCYALKQHQRRYPTYRFLVGLGVRSRWAWSVVMHRGWWAQATHRSSMVAMGIRWFQEKGLRSLQRVQSG